MDTSLDSTTSNGTTKTERNFWKKYKPTRDAVSTEFQYDWDDEDVSYAGMFETFGDDLKIVLSFAENAPKKVWTLVDADDDTQRIVSGIRFVNRVCYIITEEDRKEDYEEYIV